MSKMLIDLSTEDAAKLKDYAAQHGHKVKPFVEYLVRMQIGSVPPPQVQPVKMQPAQAATERAAAKSAPAQATPERKPEQVKPVKAAPQGMREDVAALAHLMKSQPQEDRKEEAPKRQPKPWTPNKNLSAYSEEVDPGSGIFTDGKSFAVQVGPVGRQKAHFFEYLHEAEEFLADEVF